MDAHVQFLLHHQWPSPAAIRARLPHISAPGFTAGQITTHQYSLHATACRVARLSTRSRQYDDVRGFYIRAFPTSGHPKVKSDITTQPTGLLLWWDFHPLVECFYGLPRPPSVKLLFSFRTGNQINPSIAKQASGFLSLIREAFVCLHRTSIRADFFFSDA